MTVMFNSILMRMVGADGVAAIVSFARTFGFLIAALALMPQHLDVDGVWLAGSGSGGDGSTACTVSDGTNHGETVYVELLLE